MNVDSCLVEIDDILNSLNEESVQNDQNVISFLQKINLSNLTGDIFVHALNIDNLRRINREFVNSLMENISNRNIREAAFFHPVDKRTIRKKIHETIFSIEINHSHSKDIFKNSLKSLYSIVPESQRIRYIVSGLPLDRVYFYNKNDEKPLILPIKNFTYHLVCICLGLVEKDKVLPKMIKNILQIIDTNETSFTKKDFFEISSDSYLEDRNATLNTKLLLHDYYQINKCKINPYLKENMIFNKKKLRWECDPDIVRYERDEFSFFRKRKCLLSQEEIQKMKEKALCSAFERFERLKQRKITKMDQILLNSLKNEFNDIKNWNSIK